MFARKTHQNILSEKDKTRIVELRTQGYTRGEIARTMGLTYSVVVYFFKTK